MVRLSARAIIVKDGKILLNSFNNGLYYNLPGGGLEPGETLRAAVEREVLEESGYTVASKDMVYIYEYNPKRDDFRFGDRGSMSHVFLCEIKEEVACLGPLVPDIHPEDENIINTGVEWIPVQDLDAITLVPGIGQMLKEHIEGEDLRLRFLEDIH